MREFMPGTGRGFTLLETLVSIAIVVLLAGLVYAGLAPVRERGREVHCLNNLHQIARAVQMYREDYGGGEPPAALTAAQLGLPVRLHLLLPYVRGNCSVFQCPSEHWPEEWGLVTGDPCHVSYMWHVTGDDEPLPPQVKRFRDRVAERGNDTPLATDVHHGTLVFGGRERTAKVIILRLGGQVQSRFAPRYLASWEE